MKGGLSIFYSLYFLHDVYWFYNQKKIKIFIKILEVRFTVRNNIFLRTLDQSKGMMPLHNVVMK